MPDLFTPQAHARKSDGPESHAAAASVTGITQTQENILRILRNWGALSDSEIIGHYALGFAPRASESGIRSRRAELVSMGKVRKSEKCGETRFRRPCAVWEIAE